MDVDVNTNKAKRIFVFGNENTGTSSRTLENVAKFKYFGTILTNEYFINDEIPEMLATVHFRVL